MTELDVRGIAPKDRFKRIVGSYESLAVGGTLALTVDHDPECMYFTLLGTRGAGAFGFEYVERGPAVWRVRVRKLAEVPARAAPWS